MSTVKLDEALRVLNLSLEKNFPKWLFSGRGWRKWLCLLNQLIPMGRQGVQ